MKVCIRNFQSLALVELIIEGFTVIKGDSNIGKSSLVRAITSALYGRAGDDFVRRGTESASVQIEGAPKIGGGTFDVEWNKGKGVNYFKIDGQKYDKVARDVPVHLPKFGYHEIQVGDDWINPQVSQQHDRVFLLDRSGSYVHDIISQASRLSVLLRADRSCGSDLKRQRSLQKLRQGDLDIARVKLEKMSPIREFHTRIHTFKPRVSALRTLANRLEDLREMGQARKLLVGTLLLSLPKHSVISEEQESLSQRILEVRKLGEERKAYLNLPEDVPSARPVDFDGLMKMSTDLNLAKSLASERKTVVGDVIQANSALTSILQEEELVGNDLELALSSLKICPVCEQPMPKVGDAEVHSH